LISSDNKVKQYSAEALRLYNRGLYQEAKNILLAAQTENPDHIPSLELLGVITLNFDKSESDAKKIFNHILEIEPDNHHAYNNLGTVAWHATDLKEAQFYFLKAIELAPTMARSYLNLANIFIEQGKLQEAANTLMKCLEVKPDSQRVKNQLAWTHELLGDYDSALSILNNNIKSAPDHPKTRYNRGLLLLKMGNYREGWQDYEWRYALKQRRYPITPNPDTPEWNGEEIKDKILLIVEEQGFGDAIQMVRYIPKLKSMGATVIVRCRPRLIKLFKTIDDVDEVRNCLYPIDKLRARCDYHIPIMSLPRVLETELDTIPTNIPYLFPNQEKVQRWTKRIDKNKFNIGLVWSGNEKQKNNSRRSCNLQDYLPIAALPNVQLYSLQKGPSRAQLDSAIEIDIIDFSEEMKDFQDTASLMKCLDLVISIDTAVAHLAGAIGHPVWTLLDTNHCWRYSIDRSYSPWYPHMRLFRQSSPGDWQSVIESVIQAVEQETKQ